MYQCGNAPACTPMRRASATATFGTNGSLLKPEFRHALPKIGVNSSSKVRRLGTAPGHRLDRLWVAVPIGLAGPSFSRSEIRMGARRLAAPINDSLGLHTAIV